MVRHLVIGLALSAVCLGCGTVSAEARARLGLGRSHVFARPSAVPVTVRASAVPAVALPLRTASAERAEERGPAEEPVRTGGIPVVPALSVPAPKPATPWCAAGTVVGTGKGFCIIN